MAKNLLCAVLLLTLAATTAHAQTVTLRACNPGKADVDVYFAQGAEVVSQHVAPSYCATLAYTEGAMAPGLVAVGFADAQGQWGGVHRHERAPNFGPGVAQSTTQTLSVTHGATRVSIPAQFNFQPPKPVCITYRSQPRPFGPAPEYTRCDDFKYDINVLAFPDTREVAFQLFCKICDDHAEERKTPEQRSLEKQVADLKRAALDLLPWGISRQVERDFPSQDSREESEKRYREMLERDPTTWDRIGWSDVPRYASEVAGNVPNVAMRGSVAVLQGTITGMQRHNASSSYYDVFFQESPDHKFILCTTKPDALSDLFGANYSTAMVGKKIEVEGRVDGCPGGPGILLKLAHQIKLVGNGPGMVAAVTPPAFQFPDDPEHPGRTAVPSPPTREQVAAETARTVNTVGGEMYRRAHARLDDTCANEGNKRFAENPVVDQFKERQESAACRARAQAGAEQEGQKAQACARELMTRDPRMQTAAIYEGVAACMQQGPIPSAPPGLPAIELPPAR
jgi:hypothetical protein